MANDSSRFLTIGNKPVINLAKPKFPLIKGFKVLCIILVLSSTSLMPISSSAGETYIRCLLDYIQGWKLEADYARKLFTKKLREPKNMDIYVSVRAGQIYLHSNYIPPESIDHEVKCLFDTKASDVPNMVINLVGTKQCQTKTQEQLREIISGTHYYFDKRSFADPAFRSIDFSLVKNGDVVSLSKVLFKAKRPSNASKTWLIELTPGTWIPTTSPEAQKALK